MIYDRPIPQWSAQDNAWVLAFAFRYFLPGTQREFVILPQGMRAKLDIIPRCLRWLISPTSPDTQVAMLVATWLTHSFMRESFAEWEWTARIYVAESSHTVRRIEGRISWRAASRVVRAVMRAEGAGPVRAWIAGWIVRAAGLWRDRHQ